MARKTVAQWLTQLGHPDERLAHRARLKLGSLQDGDAPLRDDLVASLDDPDEDRRFWALTGLGCLQRCGALGDAVASLGARLARVAAEDPAFAMRDTALGILGRLGDEASVLWSLCNDEHPSVRAAAARALRDLGVHASPAAAAALLLALDDVDTRVRYEAAVSLKFVPLSADALEALREAARTCRDDSVALQLAGAVRRATGS